MREREVMRVRFTGVPVFTEVMLLDVCWYVAYPLSYCHVEARTEEHHVTIAQATVN
jgi:transposase-like protein